MKGYPKVWTSPYVIINGHSLFQGYDYRNNSQHRLKD